MADHAQGAAVTVRHLWKVFGLSPAAEGQLRDELTAGKASDLSARRDKTAVFAVNDVSFDIAPGEIFCVMGLSGSGKSTLVRLINRLIEPNFGSIKVDGTDITALDAEGLRNVRSTKIAMVFQNVALFPHRNVLENIAYPLEVRGVARCERLDEAARLLALIRLHGWGERRPGELSGGMQQRVGLARALAAAPKVLLMDEPFSALDPLIRRELQDEFRDIVSRTGVTTIFITHDFDEAVYLGGRIAIMRAGQFEQIGTPKEIIFGPASEYVRRFISAEAVLGACRASDLMEPPGAAGTGAGAQCGPDLPAAAVLMNFRSGSDVLHVVHDGKLLGIIHKASVPARLGAILYRHDQAKTVGATPPPGD